MLLYVIYLCFNNTTSFSISFRFSAELNASGYWTKFILLFMLLLLFLNLYYAFINKDTAFAFATLYFHFEILIWITEGF